MSLKPCDFSNSYVRFTTKNKENTARLQTESRCEFIDKQNHSEEFFLVASCKSETVYVPKNLFIIPNYDFCGIFSERDFLIFRTYAFHKPDRKSEHDVGQVKDRFLEVRLDIKRITQAQVLNEEEQVIKATLGNRPLIGRTEIMDENNQIRAILEYPIKTMNVNREKNVFQVDTGPIPLPDLTSKHNRKIERFRLAYVAYNTFDVSEFVIQQPTPIGGGFYVNHYSNIQRLRAKNSIIRALAISS